MKIIVFFRFDCFPDKYTNSEINSCMVNEIKRAPKGKDGGGRKKATASIIVMDENREYEWEGGD